MPSSFKMVDILKFDNSEIDFKIIELKKERFDLTVNSNIVNSAKVREIRRAIARLKTVLSQR